MHHDVSISNNYIQYILWQYLIQPSVEQHYYKIVLKICETCRPTHDKKSSSLQFMLTIIYIFMNDIELCILSHGIHRRFLQNETLFFLISVLKHSIPPLLRTLRTRFQMYWDSKLLLRFIFQEMLPVFEIRFSNLLARKHQN